MAKATVNMKLSSDAAVTRILHEGITTFESLTDFDDKSIKRLPTICKEDIDNIHEDLANGIQREPPVSGATISSISVRRLIVAVQAAKYYDMVCRTTNSCPVLRTSTGIFNSPTIKLSRAGSRVIPE